MRDKEDNVQQLQRSVRRLEKWVGRDREMKDEVVDELVEVEVEEMVEEKVKEQVVEEKVTWGGGGGLRIFLGGRAAGGIKHVP